MGKGYDTALLKQFDQNEESGSLEDQYNEWRTKNKDTINNVTISLFSDKTLLVFYVENDK
jgi:hypothetical protein